MGSDGNIYGTTLNGGANGSGTAFQLTPAGTLTPLYNFCAQNACADGNSPQGGLVENGNGTFYGMASYGGSDAKCRDGCGTTYRLVP
jgi:uncharacterized repeat protein (TIGR03803 family)